MGPDPMEPLRNRLVDSLVRRGYVRSAAVERALRKVPREAFISDRQRRDAYVDTPLPIGQGQTISAPHMVAIMAESLELAPGLKVLEVGAGSGYHAAVVAEVIGPEGHLFTVERIESLARSAELSLQGAGYSDRVTVLVGDGSRGLPQEAPFDRIFLACGAPDIPSVLTSQLADGGIMLIPVGDRFYQDLIRVVRNGDRLERSNLGGCVFVPLIGEHGY